MTEPNFDEFTSSEGLSSADMRSMVLKVRKLQSERYTREEFKLNFSIYDNKIAKLL